MLGYDEYRNIWLDTIYIYPTIACNQLERYHKFLDFECICNGCRNAFNDDNWTIRQALIILKILKTVKDSLRHIY